jgi:hypothetical protein
MMASSSDESSKQASEQREKHFRFSSFAVTDKMKSTRIVKLVRQKSYSMRRAFLTASHHRQHQHPASATTTNDEHRATSIRSNETSATASTASTNLLLSKELSSLVTPTNAIDSDITHDAEKDVTFATSQSNIAIDG